VLTAKNKKREMEFFPSKTVSCIKDLKLNEFVKENIEKAMSVLYSKPSKHFEGGVVLSEDALRDFFRPDLTLNPIFTHCSSKIKHMGLSKYGLNNPISDFKKDKLTAYANPTVKFNPASSNFDEDGISARKTLLIEEGFFKNYFSSKRFADYLKIEPTGPFGCVEIKCGSIPSKNLFFGKKFEIVSFSSFTPNSISGDFSAEIRLGYVHSDGKKQAVKGGMFTGNVFDLIENIVFSKEKTVKNGYVGPKNVLFEKAVVAGMQENL
jgi:PmbA protein